MTSLQTSLRTNEPGYFINVASLENRVSAYNATTGQFSTATWCRSSLAVAGGTISTITHTPGGAVLRDLGKTVVSSNRTFRKVQLQVPGATGGGVYSTSNGVGGSTATTLGEDYFTGYVELGFEGQGSATPVARFGR